MFTYEADGSPMTVSENGTVYYYVTNLQGDVMAILNSSGSSVVQYAYDAWGKLLGTTGTMATTLGTYNPLRYRGYVYDTETGFYYLQSRYYNPTLGRFLNADAFTSTGDGIMGNNMFAYCGNNPVNYADSAGCARHHVEIMCAGYGLADINNDDPLITQANLKAYGHSYYKGAKVYSVPLPINNGAFSYGAIVMDDYFEESSVGEFVDTLNHEYGHIVQFRETGPVDYFGMVAVPSLIGAGVSLVDSEFGQYDYYDQPWERVANYYGDVNSSHTPAVNVLASVYWRMVRKMSFLTWY